MMVRKYTDPLSVKRGYTKTSRGWFLVDSDGWLLNILPFKSEKAIKKNIKKYGKLK